jgi:hypothetical protein
LRPIANAALWAATIAVAFWLARLAGRGRAASFALSLAIGAILLFLPYAAGALPLQHGDDSVVGVGGLLVTTLGFVVAIWQILDTKRLAAEAKDSATAAQQAAKRTMSDNRAHFLKFEISFVQRLFGLAEKNVERKQWTAGADFLAITADCTVQVLAVSSDQSDSSPLALLGKQLRQVSLMATRVAAGTLTQRDFYLQHWTALVTTFWGVTNEMTTALPVGEQEP